MGSGFSAAPASASAGPTATSAPCSPRSVPASRPVHHPQPSVPAGVREPLRSSSDPKAPCEEPPGAPPSFLGGSRPQPGIAGLCAQELLLVLPPALRDGSSLPSPPARPVVLWSPPRGLAVVPILPGLTPAELVTQDGAHAQPLRTGIQ